MSALNEAHYEILLLVAEGYTCKDIQAELGIPWATAQHRVNRLLRGLGARNRAHAVAIAYHRGILVPLRQRPVMSA